MTITSDKIGDYRLWRDTARYDILTGSIKETIAALRAEGAACPGLRVGGLEYREFGAGVERALDVLIPEIALLEGERDTAYDAVTHAVEGRNQVLSAAMEALPEDIRIAADGDIVAGVKGLEAAYRVERKAVEGHAAELGRLRCALCDAQQAIPSVSELAQAKQLLDANVGRQPLVAQVAALLARVADRDRAEEALRVEYAARGDDVRRLNQEIEGLRAEIRSLTAAAVNARSDCASMALLADERLEKIRALEEDVRALQQADAELRRAEEAFRVERAAKFDDVRQLRALGSYQTNLVAAMDALIADRTTEQRPLGLYAGTWETWKSEVLRLRSADVELSRAEEALGCVGTGQVTSGILCLQEEIHRQPRRADRQTLVGRWCVAAFGEKQTTSLPYRGIRFMEEAIETAQAAGCDQEMIHRLVDYVFARPVGQLGQELGGVGVTVLALANAAGLDADAEERAEVDRVLAKPLAFFCGAE